MLRNIDGNVVHAKSGSWRSFDGHPTKHDIENRQSHRKHHQDPDPITVDRDCHPNHDSYSDDDLDAWSDDRSATLTGPLVDLSTPFLPPSAALTQASNEPDTPGTHNVVTKAADPVAAPVSGKDISSAMGQRQSIVRRKSTAKLDQSAPSTPAQTPSVSTIKPVIEHERPLPSSTAALVMSKPPIPRRKSSVTRMHLDQTIFVSSVTAAPAQLRHRASTLTSTHQKELASSTESDTPVTTTDASSLTKAALSLRDELDVTAGSRDKSEDTSTDVNFFTVPKAVSAIHFPKTFPAGAAPAPEPKLKDCHYRCFQRHRKMPRSSNKFCPVPCMICASNKEEDDYWKCVWCYLRVCGSCMASLNSRQRDLEQTVAARVNTALDGRGSSPLGPPEIRVERQRGKRSEHKRRSESRRAVDLVEKHEAHGEGLT